MSAHNSNATNWLVPAQGLGSFIPGLSVLWLSLNREPLKGSNLLLTQPFQGTK